MTAKAPLVGLIMGSQSDWPTMRHAAEILDALSVPYETRIVSAHRTPDRLYQYATSALARACISAGGVQVGHCAFRAISAVPFQRMPSRPTPTT